MTNAEKYLKDGVVVKELWETFQAYYYKNKSKESDVAEAFRNFFEKETQPALTEDERAILRNIKWRGYSATHIGRVRENKESFIYLRFENDTKMTYYFNNFFGHLFQSIKERRRI